ncbi:hypothetical protein FJD38_21270 [Pseudomonas saxonica]|uniref:DUF4150 domain-containing protein n=1 Tax=Pseudomonas saxonica TaxID=2600598 RepID=A0ABY3GCC0_9PSED|nr:hypothetical protein [Pseudomonas saxonica]TWR86181.1 hypothetical protein FJD38_21270 [Pseudomonas saxonica]
MAEPLEINISKSFVEYGGKQCATFESGGGVTVQIWKGQQLEQQQNLSYADYALFREQAPEIGLRAYPDPALRPKGGTSANGNTLGRVVGQTAPTAVPAEQANPPIEVEGDTEQSWWGSASPWVHGGLDVLGFVPGLGALPDVINAGIYAAEGDAANARLSALAAIPFAGDALKGGVLVGKGIHKAGAHAGKEIAETTTNTVGKKTVEPPPPKETSGGKSKGQNRNCRLRAYGKGKNCPMGKTAHHVVPDRVFKTEKGVRIAGGVSHSNGYCLCVDGATPRRKGAKANEHGLIHKIYDTNEKLLGSKGNPPGTATLAELEILGVMAAAAVTGCNPVVMLAELHAYHASRGMAADDLFRADPNGRWIKHVDITTLGSHTTKGSGGL